MSRTRSVALPAFLLALTACTPPAANAPQQALTGETRMVHGASVASFATLGSDGHVTEAGFTMPIAAVEAAPTAADAPLTVVSLPMPARVRETTFIDHVQIDYAAQGHPPANIYTVPHFDLHFYTMTEAEVKGIDCRNETAPAADRIPANYALLPPPKGECVPMMGTHALDTTSPELRPENPEKFARAMVLGFYDGRMIFIEPMVTREFLLGRQNFELAVPRPTTLGRATRYPSRATATYDPSVAAYRFVLSGFSPLQ